MEGTTSTHQHGFDGAFRVVCGSSLHVGYTFDQQESMAEGHLVTGQLAMIEPEILWPGDVRPIVAGPDFIHALFHLERPSMTIVVRNGSSGLPFPQYDYRLPGLGFDVLEKDDRFLMRMRGMHTLYRLDPAAAAAAACDLARSEDLWTAFRVCDDWAFTYGESADLSNLIEVLAGRAGVFEDLMPPMYAERVRRGRLFARRGLLRGSRHRLFLALIVNLPDRTSIHRAMEQLFPGQDPSKLIVDLVEELASPEYRGISGLSLGPDELATLTSQLHGSGTGEALVCGSGPVEAPVAVGDLVLLTGDPWSPITRDRCLHLVFFGPPERGHGEKVQTLKRLGVLVFGPLLMAAALVAAPAAGAGAATGAPPRVAHASFAISAHDGQPSYSSGPRRCRAVWIFGSP